MVSTSALLINLLLASLTLGAPSLLEARLARRRENRQSRPVQGVDASASFVSHANYSQNWAGAVWDENNGTFTTITGTFTVPTPSGSNGAASAWVGIDGDSCQTAILQTGVDFTITNGQVSYDAWYEWYPDNSYDFDGIHINAGDEIKTTVTASSATSGTAVIENLTTGKTVTKALTSTYPLCEQDAEWIVEDFAENNGTLVAFADFGSVTFTDATASGPSGTTYTPDGAKILDIKQNNTVFTSTSNNGDTVTVTYI